MPDVHHQEQRLEAIPDLIGMHERNPSRYPFLLESAATGTTQGRYSLLFGFPGESLSIVSPDETDFLASLDELWRRERLPPAHSSLPFQGGWFFYLSYEVAGQVEPGLKLPVEGEYPIATAVRIPGAVIIDHVADEAWVVAETDHADCLPRMIEDANASSEAVREEPAALLAGELTEDEPDVYCRAVERARQYIHDGDVFQANLSRSWHGRVAPETTHAAIYRRLRSTNPGPFAGLAVFDDHAVISSSPERLVSRRGNQVDTRPIAGTRRRGQEQNEDADLRSELIGHPKERAEHIMLIDLERNDLGRICRPGSVEVSELMVLESYAHVHHIVSNVRGRVDDSVPPGDVLRAVFPGGTITGCPKVRCMEIIAELEGRPRGAYTGTMGYLNRDGSMDSNILIRTIEVTGEKLQLLAGAGIVADSIPERELDETRAKARGMILALDGEA